MCASCGCETPNDDHGDKRNITLDQLQQAAEAANISLADIGDNIADAAAEAANSGTGATAT